MRKCNKNFELLRGTFKQTIQISKVFLHEKVRQTYKKKLVTV